MPQSHVQPHSTPFSIRAARTFQNLFLVPAEGTRKEGCSGRENMSSTVELQKRPSISGKQLDSLGEKPSSSSWCWPKPLETNTERNRGTIKVGKDL